MRKVFECIWHLRGQAHGCVCRVHVYNMCEHAGMHIWVNMYPCFYLCEDIVHETTILFTKVTQKCIEVGGQGQGSVDILLFISLTLARASRTGTPQGTDCANSSRECPVTGQTPGLTALHRSGIGIYCQQGACSPLNGLLGVWLMAGLKYRPAARGVMTGFPEDAWASESTGALLCFPPPG